MEQKQLEEILNKHRLWLSTCGEEGERADLRGADLRGANLRGANLRAARLASASLADASLADANLRGANLRGADFSGADIDYSCWPLWCGSLDVTVDARIARQLAYHFCRLNCDDPEYKAARNAIAEFANGFHRVGECGRIEAETEITPDEDQSTVV